MEILANFLVNLINNTFGKLIFFKVCRNGECIIRTYLGRPIGWYSRPSVYFNVPFFQELIRVDMRRRFDTLYAHSFHFDEMEKLIIPYNIIVDFQIEYQVKHPYIIFDIEEEASILITEDRKYESTKVKYMIENIIHSELSIYIHVNNNNITYDDLIKFTDNMISKYKIIKDVDEKSDYNKDTSFSINNIVITSFDKNISLRTTV